MGWKERESAARRASLIGLTVAVDVQHLYRSGQHAGDRGAEFTLANGTHTDEAAATLGYGAALAAALEGLGARVLRNRSGLPDGPYSARQRAARDAGALIYLACHVNAGGGGYGVVEYMAASSMSRRLGDVIAGALVPPAVPKCSARSIAPHERGAVCIEGHPGASVILEPFFGDNPYHQYLFAAPALVTLGQMIAAGVAWWWKQDGDGASVQFAQAVAQNRTIGG